MQIKNKTNRLQKFTLMLILIVSIMIGYFGVDAMALSDRAVQTYSFGESVYLGGMPIGVTLKLNSPVVMGIGNVITSCRAEKPADGKDVEVGDVIKKVNNVEVESVKELSKMIENSSGDVTLDIIRKNRDIRVVLTPVVDFITKTKKIGLLVKDMTSGIGTVTFIRENGDFMALGHPITCSMSGEILKVSGGKAHECRIVGVKKGEKGKAGELQGMLVDKSKSIGLVNENSKFGISGRLNSRMKNKVMDEPINACGRGCAKVGRAQILTTLGESGAKLYDISIVKCLKQNKPDDKGLVIKVTDKELIEKAGGIVQGMSGSPIIQDGKLIGAVTHVFLNDATRGYGVYIDFML